MNGAEVLIDVAVVAGAGMVLPAATGRGAVGWRVVAASAAVALALATSPMAGAFALPWVAMGVWCAWGAAVPLLRSPIRTWTLERVAPVVLAAFTVIAGAFLVDSCFGHHWFGYGEPITRLTAVHFTFAGAGTTALALAAVIARPQRWRRLGLCVVMVAPPLVAVGFTTGWSLFQVGGPFVMAAGAYLVGAAHLHDGWTGRGTVGGRLVLVSGLSVWVPMVLAVAYALSPHTGGPALSIPDMVRIHGGTQALGFIGCGLAGRWLLAHRSVPTSEEEPVVSGAPADGARVIA